MDRIGVQCRAITLEEQPEERWEGKDERVIKYKHGKYTIYREQVRQKREIKR